MTKPRVSILSKAPTDSAVFDVREFIHTTLCYPKGDFVRDSIDKACEDHDQLVAALREIAVLSRKYAGYARPSEIASAALVAVVRKQKLAR